MPHAAAGCPRRLLEEATIAGLIFIKKAGKIKAKIGYMSQKFCFTRLDVIENISVFFRLEFMDSRQGNQGEK